MADNDFTDELEPLFDYSRVQPSNIIPLDADDDDEDVVCLAKKIRTSRRVEDEKKKKNHAKDVPVVDIDDDDDEDDWLPPPPKVSSNAQKIIDEDSTLKKLRLKKQELLSFAESAKDLMKSVEESAKKEICDSLKPSVDVISEKTSISTDRPKILITIQDKNETKQIRMYMDDNFERIVKTYAEKMSCSLDQIVLSFDGDKVSSSESPSSLGMEDNDIIELHIKSS